jgi:hypothetical protein
MEVYMRFISRLRVYTLISLAAAVLAIGWITTVLAQVADGDGDIADGDEFSALALLLGVAAIAVVGWVAYNRRSTRTR